MTISTPTTFNVVRQEVASVVFVLDVSGSMTNNDNKADRMSRVKQAVKKWIQYEATDGAKVGIVSFA